MKAGAEDLWNEADGPIKSAPEPKPVGRSGRTPIDIRKLISESEGRNSTDLMKPSKPRYYSVCRLSWNGSRFGFERDGSDNRLRDRGLISRSIGTNFGLRELMSDCDRARDSTCLNGGLKSRCYSVFTRRGAKGSRFDFRRNESSEDSDSDDEFGDGEEGKMRGRDNAGKLMSSAGLGKYDVKKTRRVPLKFLEEEENLSERVEAIRKEFNMRNLVQNAVDGSDEDSILSEKRYLHCFTHQLLNFVELMWWEFEMSNFKGIVMNYCV